MRTLPPNRRWRWRSCAPARGEGSDAPEEGADASDAANAEAIEQDSDGELAEGVGQVIRAGEVAEHDVRDAKGDVQSIVRSGEIDAVEVVDEDADGEEPRDAAAAL